MCAFTDYPATTVRPKEFPCRNAAKASSMARMFLLPLFLDMLIMTLLEGLLAVI
jgi:hypothetical protein